MRTIRGLALALLAGAFAAARADSSEAIRSAIRDLGDPRFETREEASRFLLDRGAEAPERVLPLLPVEDADPEVRERAEALKRGIPPRHRRHQVLRFAEGKPDLERALKAFDGPLSEGSVDALVKEALSAGCEGALMLLADRMGPAEPQERPLLAQGMLRLSERGDSALALAFRALGGGDTLDKSEVRVNGRPARHVRNNARAFQIVLEAILPRLLSGTGEALLGARGPEGSRAAGSLLVTLLGDRDPNVAVRAAEALTRLGDRSVLPEVAQFLVRPSAVGRVLAVRLLGDMQATEFAKPLLALLKDPSTDVSHAAALALGKMGVKEAIPDLLGLLETGNPNDHAVAARALADLGVRSAVPRIARTLLGEEGTGFYPGRAAEAMGKLVGQPWSCDEAGIKAARTWWAAHKDDPEFAPGTK